MLINSLKDITGMRVADLKLELKKRGISTLGGKDVLVERLSTVLGGEKKLKHFKEIDIRKITKNIHNEKITKRMLDELNDIDISNIQANYEDDIEFRKYREIYVNSNYNYLDSKEKMKIINTLGNYPVTEYALINGNDDISEWEWGNILNDYEEDIRSTLIYYLTMELENRKKKKKSKKVLNVSKKSLSKKSSN